MRRFASLHAAVAAAALTACNASTSAPALSPAGHTLASHQTALAGPATVVVRNGLTLHLFLTRDAARALPATTNNLLYHGGPIQTSPRIYVVLWGTWDSSGDPNGVSPVLQSFLRGVGGSQWLSSVTQYTQKNGAHVGNPSGDFKGVWNDTGDPIPAVVQDSDIGNEAIAAAAHFRDYGTSASYVIATPHLHNDVGFGIEYCAWHSSETAAGHVIAFTNLPYIPDAGSNCGQGSVNSPGTLDGVSIVEGHEQGETETDPHPSSGWIDVNNNENGDKCAWIGLQNTTFSTGTFPTQPLWSNATASCMQ